MLALALLLRARRSIAAFEKAPRYATYFRIAAVSPFLYALYAVFIGSANGLRRFRTQASFDVGFSTAKTILLLGARAALEGHRRLRRLRGRGRLHPGRRFARDAPAAPAASASRCSASPAT